MFYMFVAPVFQARVWNKQYLNETLDWLEPLQDFMNEAYCMIGELLPGACHPWNQPKPFGGSLLNENTNRRTS